MLHGKYSLLSNSLKTQVAQQRPTRRFRSDWVPDHQNPTDFMLSRRRDGRIGMKQMPCIEDLRQRARRNVPRMFFDYAEAGSYSQETLRANRSDMERIKLRQRVLVNVDQRSTATTILGEPVPVPLALGPIGLGGMMHGDGEILACQSEEHTSE